MARYEPTEVPRDLELFLDWFSLELRRLVAALAEVEGISLPELHVEPERPRDGMIVLADGTDWNPGSGAGFYGRRGGSWVLLG